MKIRLFILCMFAVLILFGSIGDSFAEKKIKLYLGQTKNAENLKFTFQNIEDSRCPSDVTCVWGGQVITTIQIQNQTHTKTVDLAPNGSYTFFSPYKIILLDVSPYPVSTKIPDDHIATLVMFSTDGTSPCENDKTINNFVI